MILYLILLLSWKNILCGFQWDSCSELTDGSKDDGENFVYCYDGMYAIMKLSTGTDSHTYREPFLMGESSNNIEIFRTIFNHDKHIVFPIPTDWEEVDQVVMILFDEDLNEVLKLNFDSSVNHTSWFGKQYIVDSPWDLDETFSGNVFDMTGKDPPDMSSCCDRWFYISLIHALGCPGDRGLLCFTSGRYCSWEFRYNLDGDSISLLYSKTHTHWTEAPNWTYDIDDVGVAAHALILVSPPEDKSEGISNSGVATILSIVGSIFTVCLLACPLGLFCFFVICVISLLPFFLIFLFGILILGMSCDRDDEKKFVYRRIFVCLFLPLCVCFSLCCLTVLLFLLPDSVILVTFATLFLGEVFVLIFVVVLCFVALLTFVACCFVSVVLCYFSWKSTIQYSKDSLEHWETEKKEKKINVKMLETELDDYLIKVKKYLKEDVESFDIAKELRKVTKDPNNFLKAETLDDIKKSVEEVKEVIERVKDKTKNVESSYRHNFDSFQKKKIIFRKCSKEKRRDCKKNLKEIEDQRLRTYLSRKGDMNKLLTNIDAEIKMNRECGRYSEKSCAVDLSLDLARKLCKYDTANKWVLGNAKSIANQHHTTSHEYDEDNICSVPEPSVPEFEEEIEVLGKDIIEPSVPEFEEEIEVLASGGKDIIEPSVPEFEEELTTTGGKKNIEPTAPEIDNGRGKNASAPPLPDDVENCDENVLELDKAASEKLGVIENVCYICQENVKDRVLECGHTFCRYCIKELQKRRKKCPNCRKSITTVRMFFL